jgi:phosphoribosylformylglycinamidine synthase subunit PurQ / glutaminase
MKCGVVVFPGSNCDEDMMFALRENLGHQVLRLWHKNTDLEGVDMVVLPGGFSYGDYLRSGAIARFSPIMDSVITHAQKGGYVLGVCNGFQILTEAHLLPGALLRNNSRRFQCENIHLVADGRMKPMLEGLEAGRPLQIPIAHADGRYYAPDALLDELEAEGQVIFRYANAEGAVEATANPNGSERNIAGVCNRAGNVFGLMPHPERASDPALGNTDGAALLATWIGALEEKMAY